MSTAAWPRRLERRELGPRSGKTAFDAPARPRRSHGIRCLNRRCAGSSLVLRAAVVSRRNPPSRDRSSSCSDSSTAMTRCGGMIPAKRPSPSTTHRADSGCRTARDAPTSWSIPGATIGAPGSMIDATSASPGAARASSIVTTPRKTAASQTTIWLALSYRRPPGKAPPRCRWQVLCV